MIRFFGIVLLISAVYAEGKYEKYDGSSIYEFNVKNEKDAQAVRFLEEQLGLDIWSSAGPSKAGHIFVPKELKDEFEYKMKMAGINYKMGIENIKEYMDLEDKLLTAAASKNSTISRSGLTFDRIYTYEEIDEYLELLAREYPATVTVVNGGNSFQGRPIKYLRISTTNFQDKSKPIVYIQSLIHCREWITQAVSLYAIHKLVIDVSERDLLNDIDWIILPVANPDGFVYTQGTGLDRYWRKNRATGYMSANICRGVDLNRNFDIFWGTASSSSVCSDTFHGSQGFSEPETIVIRDILHQYRDRIELFIDLHSYGSFILYGYGNGAFPPNALILNFVGVQMAQAIDKVKQSYNPNYVVGNLALVISYEASGSAMDYAMSVGVPLAFSYELPIFRFGGQSLFGFLVDPDFIEPAGFETWEGIKVAARYARNSYRTRNQI